MFPVLADTTPCSPPDTYVFSLYTETRLHIRFRPCTRRTVCTVTRGSCSTAIACVTGLCCSVANTGGSGLSRSIASSGVDRLEIPFEHEGTTLDLDGMMGYGYAGQV